MNRYLNPYALGFALTLALIVAILAQIVSAQAKAPSSLVDTGWLRDALGKPGLVVVDIRSPIGKSSYDDYANAHIPGSVHSGYAGAWRTEKNGVVGVLPDIAVLEDHIGSLGIDNSSTVVIVPAGASATEFGAAARIFWTLRYLGHDDVAILDGGWAAWSADPANPVSSEVPTVRKAAFTANPRPELLVTTADVAERLDGGAVLVDARPEQQYVGLAQHPKASRPGRIPGAVHADNHSFYDQVRNRLRPQSDIAGTIPQSVRAGDAQEIISYCNTGHWAATNWFVMSEVLGLKNVRLYDHSMVGWTQNANLPVVTGN